MAIKWKFSRPKLGNIFYRSRRRLTLLYSSLMFLLFVVIIMMSYRGMIWAVSSEQAYELSGVVQDVAAAEAIMMQRQNDFPDDLGQRERMFFYAYDKKGNLLHFSKAPARVEEDVLSFIRNGEVPLIDVTVFEEHSSEGHVVMMSSAPVIIRGEEVGIIYVGKDISALYKGVTKYSYFLVLVSFIALIAAAAIGYYISGKIMASMQAAYDRQKQFTADASHELRTPLSVVMASADLLSNDPSIQSPFLKQVIEDVKDEVKKMSKLVGDLLTIARSDNSAEKYNMAEFDFSASVQQVVRNMQYMAEKKKITLVGNVAEGITYYGDKQKIEQLILIFVDNAIKYTPESGLVTVTAEHPKGKKVRFSVEDNGIGLAKEDQDKIFGRFYRVDKARSREMGGNGLGLSIAKDIIEVHHGNVYIDSELGKGSKFTIELNGGKK